VGDVLTVRAEIQLGKLDHTDVAVELYTGVVNADGSLVDAVPVPMTWKEKTRDTHLFEGAIPFGKSGRIGYGLRVIPAYPDPSLYSNHSLIKWA
jgi:starch phosphorylase